MKVEEELHAAGADEAEFNPYLAGLYAPVDREIDAVDLQVIGEIPPDLDGVFLRNGPNPAYAPRGRYHWFDGDGMVHGLRFRDGKASYANRWINTYGYAHDREADAPLWTGIMEPVRGNPRGVPLKDSANTDLVFFRDRVLALWYLCGDPYGIDPVTLATIGSEDFGGTRTTRLSAHAKVDEATGELLFFDYAPVPPYLRYGVVGPAGTVTNLVEIELPGPRLPHDMAATEHWSILMDLPLINDEEAAKQGRHKIVFRRDLPARFGLIPRHGEADEVRWFEADPCYIYHSVNAWEEGDEVVLDVCRVTKPAPRGDAVGALAKMLSYLRLDAHLYRYRFNLATGATREEFLDDDNTEFPSMDLRRLGRPSSIAYCMRISPEPTLLFDGIVKHDTAARTQQHHWFGAGRWGSEAPFAPRNGSVSEDCASEDDGYLVSFVHDQSEDRSEVVVLDASDLAAGPVARVLLPQRVPIGFHATWVRGDQLIG